MRVSTSRCRFGSLPAALLLVLTSIHFGPSALGQSATDLASANYGTCGGKQVNTVICLLPTTLGPALIASSQTLGFPPLYLIGGLLQSGASASPNGIFGGQITSALPLPSPAAGFTYVIDTATGLPVRTSESLGPIMVERAETIGKHHLAIGFTFQRFTFDEIDGIDLHNINFFIPLQGGLNLKYNNNTSLSLNQATFYGIYGISSRVDVSVSIPINTVRYGTSAVFFVAAGAATPPPNVATFPIVSNATRTATGLGDVTFQVKGSLLQGERGNLVAGLAVRIGSGDEYNALGAGTYGIRPFMAASYRFGRVTPHINIGFEYNGKSILAGNTMTGDKRNLPSEFLYAAGFDVAVHRRLTTTFDLLGRELGETDRIMETGATIPGGNTRVDAFTRGHVAIVNGAVGFKLNFYRDLVFGTNLLFRMNDAGLRSKVAPLFTLSYAR